MKIDEESIDIRHGLLEFAESGVARATRGLITQWFPFIYQAARRLSTRTISRWLEETHNIKISPASVSKALRESDKHWEGYWELIEPAAHNFGTGHNVAMESFLFKREFFESLASEDIHFEDAEDESKYWEGLDALRNAWFVLDDKTLDKMRRYVPRVSDERKEEEGENDETASK